MTCYVILISTDPACLLDWLGFFFLCELRSVRALVSQQFNISITVFKSNGGGNRAAQNFYNAQKYYSTRRLPAKVNLWLIMLPQFHQVCQRTQYQDLGMNCKWDVVIYIVIIHTWALLALTSCEKGFLCNRTDSWKWNCSKHINWKKEHFSSCNI